MRGTSPSGQCMLLIPAMREVDLAGIDLNLLVSLRALLLERHVTRAALRTGVSQPAMSRALGRLRELFGDPLLVRVGSTMQATPRAAGLLVDLDDVLARIKGLLDPTGFDPSAVKGEIRLCVPDALAYQLVPAVLRLLAQAAPESTLRVVDWSANWREQLSSGDVDVTIGAPVGHEAGLYSREFAEWPWACVLRKKHPAAKKRWNVATYAGLDHIVITMQGHRGNIIDEALAQLSHERRIGLKMPYHYWSVAPLLVLETDMVFSTAEWVARKYASLVPLIVRKLPLELQPTRFAMVWHERTHRDPRAAWVREQLRLAVKTADLSMLRPS